MKKLFFTLALVLGFSAAASAQGVGQVWVGGNFGFKVTDVKGGDSNTDFKILPEIGYIINDNFGVGIRGGYEHYDAYSISYGTQTAEFEADGFSVEPFVRYTFLKGDIGGLFLDGGVGYGQLSLKNVDDKIKALEAGISPGVAISISDKVALTAKYGFLGYKETKIGDGKVSEFGLDFDMTQFTFGINFVF